MQDIFKDRFKGQVAVISGGGEGIGKAIANRLALEGATVVVFDSSQMNLERLANNSSISALKIQGYRVDISDEDQIKAAYDQVIQKWGRIDVMINSAGIVGPTNTSIVDYPVAEFDRVYSVNLRGAFLMAKYALAHMHKNHYGRILLIASIAGKEGNPFMAGYSASKSGVIGLVKGLGKEYADKSITVNGLAPAVIRTVMNEDTAPEQLAYMIGKIPMGRLGTVEEVASMAAFIVSKENSFSTGFVYDISGGRATY